MVLVVTLVLILELMEVIKQVQIKDVKLTLKKSLEH